MRVTVTVVQQGVDAQDVLVTADDSASAGDVALALGRAVGAVAQEPVGHGGGVVVQFPGQRQAGGYPEQQGGRPQSGFGPHAGFGPQQGQFGGEPAWPGQQVGAVPVLWADGAPCDPQAQASTLLRDGMRVTVDDSIGPVHARRRAVRALRTAGLRRPGRRAGGPARCRHRDRRLGGGLHRHRAGPGDAADRRAGLGVHGRHGDPDRCAGRRTDAGERTGGVGAAVAAARPGEGGRLGARAGRAECAGRAPVPDGRGRPRLQPAAAAVRAVAAGPARTSRRSRRRATAPASRRSP